VIGFIFTLNKLNMYNEYNTQSYLDANVADQSVVKDFMARTFLWMAGALAITSIVCFVLMSNQSLMLNFFDMQTGRTNILGKIVMFAPLLFVLTMSFAYNKLNTIAMAALFVVYAAINGVTFSFILMAYTQSSILGAFVGAASMFAVMAVMGYTTKTDLTSFGRIMMMGLIGMLVMSLVNMFMGSDTMSYVIGLIGVAVFTGLTAYDVQKLKNMAAGIDANGDTLVVESTRKLAIYGALTLYLDFINLFLSLLRVFGRRD
jgi:FtsH-binding integral membrane protein